MKKVKLILPFPFFVAFFFLYSFLDGAIFVNVFGCGCSENAFNANDLKWVVYGLLTVGMTAFSAWLSKSVSDKWLRVLYCIVVLAFYCSSSLFICKTLMWR